MPLLPIGASNPRLVEAFSTDEAIQTNLMANALRAHTWKLQFGAYGHLYLNACLAVEKLLSSTTTRSIVVDARAISLVSAMGLLLTGFLWARRLYGRAVAWLTLALVAANPTVYLWACVVHPDMLQAFLLLLALWMTTKVYDRPTTTNIVVASVVSGLAFAVKYSGMFVLPLIAVGCIQRKKVVAGPGADRRINIVRTTAACIAVILLAIGLLADQTMVTTYLTADGQIDVPLPMSIDHALWLVAAFGGGIALVVVTPWLWRAMLERRALSTTLWGIAVMLVAFTAAFIVASPYSLWKLAFIKGLYFEATETGAVLNREWATAWLVGGGRAIGWSIVVPFAAAAAWMLLRRHSRTLSNAERVMLAWIGLYTLVLFAPAHEKLFHYTLPLIVPAAIVAASGLASLSAMPATLVLALALLVAGEAPGVNDLLSTRSVLLARESDPVVIAGQWLEQEVPPSARIAYDYTSYVPPRFTNVIGVWGVPQRWLTINQPDFVVTNEAVADLSKDHPDIRGYYDCLANGTCGYRARFSVAAFTIYERIQPADDH